jgi:hypothetical protein
MYRSFEARHFRALDRIELVDLSRLNIVTGINNIGKTALIEAIFVHSGAYAPQLMFQLNGFRGLQEFSVEFSSQSESPWDSFFPNFDTSEEVELSGLTDEVGRRNVRLKLVTDPETLGHITAPVQVDLTSPAATSSPEPMKVLALSYKDENANSREQTFYQIVTPSGIRVQPAIPILPFRAFFISAAPPRAGEEARFFGQIQVNGLDKYVLETLRVMEPGLKRLLTVVLGQTPVIHGDIGTGRLIPLPLMGAGMSRMAQIVTYMASVQKGVLLIDEIENGLHYSILQDVWRSVARVAKTLDVQIFATTHSRECVIAAHRAMAKESMQSDLHLYRLDRDEDGIAAKLYDHETLLAAVQTGLEFR